MASLGLATQAPYLPRPPLAMIATCKSFPLDMIETGLYDVQDGTACRQSIEEGSLASCQSEPV